MQACECAVPPDGDQRIDADLLQAFVGFAASLFGPEFRTTRRLQNCASALNNVADRTGAEADNVAVDHALVTAHDPVYFLLVVNGRSYHRTDRCGHSRRVTARCEDTDLAYLLFHLHLLIPVNLRDPK